VKKYYFEKESQVHQLQNTLAHQRLSASRTSLDDSEYCDRFARLNGQIQNLSFGIRKSWEAIPEWLQRVVNKDALATGTREMTAVGRAYISWWLWSQLFERVFHPDLDPEFSQALRSIANNIRRNAPPAQSGEEEEALSSKICSWRMATIEGLQDQLRSAAAQQNRSDLVTELTERLVSDTSSFLVEPTPQELIGGVAMIVELAVNIAVHIPMESREVGIEYYPPLYMVIPDLMTVEQGIPVPPLTAPIQGDSPSDSVGADAAMLKGERDGADNKSRASAEEQHPPSQAAQEHKGKRGVLAGLMGSKPTSNAPPAGMKPGSSGSVKANTGSGTGGPNPSGRETPTGQSGAPKEERVRFAVGLGVVIRGRRVLVKTPIFTTSV
jgi:hypothetical protein